MNHFNFNKEENLVFSQNEDFFKIKGVSHNSFSPNLNENLNKNLINNDFSLSGSIQIDKILEESRLARMEAENRAGKLVKVNNNLNYISDYSTRSNNNFEESFKENHRKEFAKKAGIKEHNIEINEEDDLKFQIENYKSKIKEIEEFANINGENYSNNIKKEKVKYNKKKS